MDEKNQKITVTSLAQHFNVSKSTVSNMIKKLIAMNLVNSKPYKPIVLTKFGRKTGTQIISKHRLIELYLVKKMNFNEDEVHEIAEEIEHIKNTKFLIECKKFWVIFQLILTALKFQNVIFRFLI